MINLPPNLTPSELLCREELSPFVDKLLQTSRSMRREGRFSEARRLALDAVEAGQESVASTDQAVALVHLADVHREMGELGPALAECERAYPVFQRQTSGCQRHNEAVAAYALGVVHQLLGSDMDALRWYQESVRLFDRVKEDWAAVNALAQVEVCARVQRWMKTVSEYLTAVRTRADVDPVVGIWVPIILSDGSGEPGFAVAKLGIGKYVMERRLIVNGKVFRVQRLEGGPPVLLTPGVEYYALEVPDEARDSLGVGEGDYALIERGRSLDQEGPGVLETDEPTFGHFERDEKGKISFTRFGTKVIGGMKIGADVQVGYVIALLKST